MGRRANEQRLAIINTLNKKENMNNTWQDRLSALGPGIIMASAAIGGSHIVMSTQAGAMFGWQLVVLILLANIFKYPFFRFGVQYTLLNQKSLVQGYTEKNKNYLYLFFILNIFSQVVNTAGVGLITAVILKFMLPSSIELTAQQLSIGTIGFTAFLVILGHYKLLDKLSKWIMIALSITTVLAVLIAMSKGSAMKPDFIEPSPWQLIHLTFLVALVGWMPAPIEISALNSMWVIAKKREKQFSYRAGIFDFNTGYIVTIILALFFVALGAYLQYGSGEQIELPGAKYIGQLVDMYAQSFGDWSKLLIAFIAFMCMFGTTITVIDGYSRVNSESLRIIMKQDHTDHFKISAWVIVGSALAVLVILKFASSVKSMLDLAMIGSFITTPVFAWLNLQLVKDKKEQLSTWLYVLSVLGLIFLSGFALFFIAHQFGFLKYFI